MLKDENYDKDILQKCKAECQNLLGWIRCGQWESEKNRTSGERTDLVQGEDFKPIWLIRKSAKVVKAKSAVGHDHGGEHG